MYPFATNSQPIRITWFLRNWGTLSDEKSATKSASFAFSPVSTFPNLQATFKPCPYYSFQQKVRCHTSPGHIPCGAPSSNACHTQHHITSHNCCLHTMPKVSRRKKAIKHLGWPAHLQPLTSHFSGAAAMVDAYNCLCTNNCSNAMLWWREHGEGMPDWVTSKR